MLTLLLILAVIISILLIGIILIQKSKGGGLSSQFGSGNQVLGVRGTNSFLEKTTWTLAILIVIISVASAYAVRSKDGSSDQGRADASMVDTKQVPAQQATNAYDNQAAPAKAAPATPATPAK